jgi:hypothetical protein
MAIQVSNFGEVWKYSQPQWGPIGGNSPIQFYNGTYLFVNCSIISGTQISINANMWDKKPETISGSYNNAKMISNLQFGNIDTDVEGNILLAAHNAIVSQSSANNPGVDFEITNLSGSVA